MLRYGGTDWFRTLILLAERFVLVIDRIHVLGPDLESGHIEWNCLGEVTASEAGFRLSQQGVYMDVRSNSSWATQLGVADQSADWKRTLDSGAYPYAKFPLPKLIFQMPGLEVGGSYCLATLLGATDSPGPAYRVYEPEPGRVCVEALNAQLPKLQVDDQDVSIHVSASLLEVRFAPAPHVPEALRIEA